LTNGLTDEFRPSCSKCPDNQAVSEDQTTCMACSGGGATFSSSQQDCLCPADTYLVERNPNDMTLLSSKRCDTCTTLAY